VGALMHNNEGAAYVFRNLDTATGTVTQNAKLVSSDISTFDYFGTSVAISGTIGLVGVSGDDIGSSIDQGSAYLYRNLDTITGTVTENAKLLASDGGVNDLFGWSVSLSGTSGLVGSPESDVSLNLDQGAAYLFHGLDIATGTKYHDAKLVASDGAAMDYFGQSVSLSGNSAVVGAHRHDVGVFADAGAAYLFRNLDAATSSATVTEVAKLLASDGQASDWFGISVALSGSDAIVGAYGDDFGSNLMQGSAYIFRNLDTATGTIYESVKLFATSGTGFDLMGGNVSIDDGRFTISAHMKDVGANSSQGVAFLGHVRTFTTADLGSDATATDGLSFISRENWIIGQSTSNNSVTLTSGDSGDVTLTGTQVYVGQNSNSNNNTLHIENGATLSSNSVNVGASGNSGNQLRANGTINLSSGSTLTVAADNILSGVGTIQGTGSGVVISGSLRPGSGDLGSGIGTLTRNNGDVTWNGDVSSAWVFELGAAQATMALANTGGTRDLLKITAGNFTKGTGSSFVFDFANTGVAGWYKLVDWTGSTTFVAGDFTATNLHPSILSYTFVVDDGPGSTTALYIYLVPEPETWIYLLAFFGVCGGIMRTQRKAAARGLNKQ